MSPSSTSSSDGHNAHASVGTGAAGAHRSGDEPGPKLSTASKRALLLCLGILLLLELGAARRDWVWNLDPRRPVGIFQAVEKEIISPAEDIRVVVLGSSVMRDGILPRAFEVAAGLPEESVLNTSMPNATPFDFVVLYERNRDELGGARLLIVGIEDWYFYEEPDVSERYHRWARLSDRLADYGGTDRLPLLVSWVWKTYAARNALALEGLGAALSGNRAEVVGPDGRVYWRPEEEATGSTAFDLGGYEDRLATRQWRDRPVRYLARLLELAAADDVPVALVRMPMRDAALRLRGQVDPDAEPRLQAAIAAALSADTRAGFLDFPAATSAGLEERHFLDERHLGTDGAEVFTRMLAAWAAENYDLR
jgi:hypothetical protein